MARVRGRAGRRGHVLRRAGCARAQSRTPARVAPGVLPAETAGWRSGPHVEHDDGAADGGAYYGSSDAELNSPMKALLRLLIVVLAIVGATALAAGAWFMRGGINSQQQPGAVETAVARRLRAAAIPSSARQAANPVTMTPEVLEDGLSHFADHCASCHGNDGGADTVMARGLYPKVPDMRLAATQELSDGELFYIIENGVRLTGMPAWSTGAPEGVEASWKLVHFIRHLPKITEAELEKMKTLNPKSSDAWREEEEARRFLEGGDDPAPPAAAPSHKHGGQQR